MYALYSFYTCIHVSVWLWPIRIYYVFVLYSRKYSKWTIDYVWWIYIKYILFSSVVHNVWWKLFLDFDKCFDIYNASWNGIVENIVAPSRHNLFFIFSKMRFFLSFVIEFQKCSIAFTPFLQGKHFSTDCLKICIYITTL